MSIAQSGSLVSPEVLRAHLEAYWLRPEAALWDAIAAARLEPHLSGRPGLMELGIGNGFFSFLMLGGRFSPDFDWFLSTRTDGFWQNQDIFDHDAGVDVARAVTRSPHTRIRYALDHKPALLAQASRLGFIDDVIEHDGNEPLPAIAFGSAYSNILYWLRDPLAAMEHIADRLAPGGELVTVFPNAGFYRACTSYSDRSEFWTLINRGRADHIMWHMDPEPFQREIEKRGRFEVRSVSRYLGPDTLRIWDIGLRPLTVPLVRLANGVSPDVRAAVKQEWCDTVEKLLVPALDNEAETGHRDGGFTLAVLAAR